MIKQPVNTNGLSARIRTFSSLDCVVPKNIHTSPTEGTFDLDPHHPGISIPGGACHIPPPLEFPLFSTLVWYPLERIFPSKMPLHHTFMQRLIVSAIKGEKYFIYDNTVSNNLNFAF